MTDKQPAFHLICKNCWHKKTIYWPFPLYDFNKIINSNKKCDKCWTEIKEITALDKSEFLNDFQK